MTFLKYKEKVFLISFLLLAISNLLYSQKITFDEYNEKYLKCFDVSCTSNQEIDNFYQNNLDSLLSINLKAYDQALINNDTALVFQLGKRILRRLFRKKKEYKGIPDFTIMHTKNMENTEYKVNAFLDIAFCYSFLNLRDKTLYYANEAFHTAEVQNDTTSVLLSAAYLLFSYHEIKNIEKVKSFTNKIIVKYEPENTVDKTLLTNYWFVYRFKMLLVVDSPVYPLERKRFLDKYKSKIEPLVEMDIQIMDEYHKISIGEVQSIYNLLALNEEVVNSGYPYGVRQYLQDKCFRAILHSNVNLLPREKWERILNSIETTLTSFNFSSNIGLTELILNKYKELGNVNKELETLRRINEEMIDNNKKIKAYDITLISSQINKYNEKQEELQVSIDKNEGLNKRIKIIMYATILLVVICLVLVAFYSYHIKVQKKLRVLNTGLVKSNQEINLKNNILQQFSHTIAHDFEEPLRSLENTVKLLVGNVLSKDEKEEVITATYGSLKYLKNLIGDFLNYSKSHQIKIHKENKTLEDALDLAKINLRKYNFEIISEKKLPEIKHNQSDFVSIFQNLIKNAIKYCPPDRSPVINISFEEQSDGVKLIVKDNGIGIAEDKLTQIFNPFMRMYPQGVAKGSGLGLTIIKNILDRYNATIVAENNKYIGARFIIFVPYKVENKNLSEQSMALKL